MSPSVLNTSTSKNPLRFILAVSKPYKWWAAATLVLGAVSNGIASLTPVIYQQIVETITALTGGGATYAQLYWWLFAYVGMYAGHILLWRGVSLLGSRWSTGVRFTARQILTNYIFAHSHRYYENRFAGSIANKINHARDGARSIVEAIFFEFWPLAITLAVSFVLAFTTNPYLGIIFFAWLVVIIPLNTWLAQKRIVHSMRVQTLETNLRGTTVDILGNIRAVREYTREQHEADELTDLMRQHQRAALKNWHIGEYMIGFNGVLQAAFMLGMVGAAVYLSSIGAISVGSIVLILSLIVGVSQNIFYIGNRIAGLAEEWSEVKEGLDDLLAPHEIVDVPWAPALSAAEGAIAFNNVSFAYPHGRTILSDFSLKIQPGEKIGIVGRSGAGKTTIIKLLLRHYKLTQGSIAIDGQDIALRKQSTVREAVSMVPQEPLLFHRTVRENIAYGKPDATEEEIIQAAKQAKAHDFILSLSDGYDTVVGERGTKLSGGERQRVAFARAILKPAKVLVLDEATAALDSESEAMIQHALRTLMEGKTVIAIAHRLSTLREMDRILVLDKGRIVEEGSHAELLGRAGVYAQLWRHQSGGYVQEEDGMYALTPEGQMQIFDTEEKSIPLPLQKKKEAAK